MVKARKDVKRRLKLEDKVKVNRRYATVYQGLKLNTAHNSAVTQMFSFLLQRIIYAAVIVLCSQQPLFATSTMIIVSVCMLTFTVTEKPWKDSEVNTLASANDFFFYTLLVLVLACSSMGQSDSRVSENLGLIMLLVFTLAIFVNLAALIAQAYHFTKLLFLRKKTLAALKLLAEKEPQKQQSADPEAEEIELEAVKVVPVVEEVNSCLESEVKEQVNLSKLITPEDNESPAVVTELISQPIEV